MTDEQKYVTLEVSPGKYQILKKARNNADYQVYIADAGDIHAARQVRDLLNNVVPVPEVKPPIFVDRVKPNSWRWDAKSRDADLQEWLGDNFKGWAEENAPGRVADQTVLYVTRPDTPDFRATRPTLFTRYEDGRLGVYSL